MTLATPDFLRAYADAIRGEHGQRQNVRRGSTIDLVGGSSALVWSALATRDRDLFRANLVDSATGEDLDRQVERRYSVTRVRDTRGVGVGVFRRPTAAAGADTLDAGTRIRVTGPGLHEVYRVTADTYVGATALTVSVPVEATRPGPGVAVSAGGSAVILDDTIFDATLLPVSLVCADGTLEETPAAYVSRGRAAKRAARLGYRSTVERVCKEAGATVVVVLAPDAFGRADDQAITNVYVGDAAYSTTSALVDACYVACESARVDGCDLQVLPMEQVPIPLSVDVVLWDKPSRFDQMAIKRDIIDALVSAFAPRPDFYLIQYNALVGTVLSAAGGAAQQAYVSSTLVPPAGPFPLILPRYTLAGTAITLRLFGPEGPT